MQKYIAAFGGDPNGPRLPRWRPYDAASDEHMKFGAEVKPGHGLFKEACDLLEKAASDRSTPSGGPLRQRLESRLKDRGR